MKSLIERWGGIWENIHQSRTKMPSWITIPNDHIDEGQKSRIPFQAGEHYFEVRVNEMYLTNSREWFSKFDPMVFAVSEFMYNGNMEAVPFLVGPMMMEKYGQKMPTGMVFSDTKVAGPHPYRGGRLNLSVVLCRVKREDYAKKLLQVIESASNALPFATGLNTYVKIGSVVLDGVEALLGLGETAPLIGLRKEFDPDAGDRFEPTYFALISKSDAEINANELWVLNNKLLYGKTYADAKSFRDAEYVLYSITQTQERSDAEEIPPFKDFYSEVKKEATVPDENSWKRAKANMLTLYQAMVTSPDLTLKQASKLVFCI